MKIEAEDGTAYAGVPLWIILAENEARDLAESLVMYFAETPRDAGWHDHIGDTLTLAIEAASGRSPSGWTSMRNSQDLWIGVSRDLLLAS